MQPSAFIDNSEGNSLARALDRLLAIDSSSHPDSSGAPVSEVRIATAFCSPAGFAQVADRLTDRPRVRLLLGADMNLGAPVQRRRLGEPPGGFGRRRVQARLDSLDEALVSERDRLPFTANLGTSLRKLVDSLRAGNIEVRRYEKEFLHAKAYIVTAQQADTPEGGQQGVIAGSSNLTAGGLKRNLELNLTRFDDGILQQACEWFDALWEEAEPYDLAVVFEEVLEPVTPWEVFIRVLWQIYGDEVEEDSQADDGLPLTNFQKHGVARAMRLIRETGGVIVADEVGLGKTFIAGEILKRYADRRQRALIVCPASLRDSTWKTFLNKYQLFAESVSFEQLAGDVQLKDKRRPRAEAQHLQNSIDEYQLIIVDEAHNYRNPDTPTRAAALRTLLFGKRRDLLLLTATPVNNSLWDLYHLLRFFLRQDSHLASKGILSIRDRFKRATRKDPLSLSPDLLYPIVDATTVKRTRQFVKKHYAGDTIPGRDGKPREIEFPAPVALSVRYELENRLPGFFDFLEEALDPDSEKAVTFIRYAPDQCRLEGLDEEEQAHCAGVVGLLRSSLLKRFESSTYAFATTVRRMARQHEVFLTALDSGRVVSSAFFQEFGSNDDEALDRLLHESEHSTDAELYDTRRLRTAVRADLEQLDELAAKAESIRRKSDPKLRVLADELAAIALQAEKESVSSNDEAQKRKVLVFTLFSDTVDWIQKYLEEVVCTRPELEAYRGRIVSVTGNRCVPDMPRQRAVQGFAPVSMEATAGQDADLFDILIATDVLSEGVNLQQCRNIINVDVPWNPMQLVQRHGRIDRIASPHRKIFLRTVFPVDRLDRLLKLEQRILGKLAMAAASVGVAAPIEGAAQGTQVFTETREEIERLLREDSSLFERGGTPGGAQTGEEYRQTLRKALENDGDRIRRLPWKVGSGMRKGAARGILFCAVVGQGTALKRTYLRFVRAAPDWTPETDAIEGEMGTCLRLLECDLDTPTSCPDSVFQAAYSFWAVAQQHIRDGWMLETDPANTQPRVRPLNHRVADFIRTHRPRGLSEERMTCALDILESPWPRREEVMLRQWFGEGDMEAPGGRVRTLVRRIIETGLEPAHPPSPLPPIELEDVELVCWMALRPAN